MQKAAMHLARANRPKGPAYNAAFKVIAARLPNLVAIEMTTRSRAIWMHENRDALEKWHASLPDHTKQQVNHPGSVKRRWDEQHRAPAAAPTNSRLRQLEQENAELKRKLERSDAGDVVSFRDTPDDIARVLFDRRVSSNKIRAITNALAKLERERRNVRGT
jgi:hypothetical protein